MKRYTKHIVIVGSARSGTSWFSELIARQHRYRILFEPEHEHNTRDGKLLCDRYITTETTNHSIKTYLKKIFSNSVDSDWIGQLSNRKWKRHLWPFIPKKYIIKFVRCNLAANYLADHFTIPVVYIVRNPYDVLASQQRVQFPWFYDLSWFQQQDALCALLKTRYNIDIRSLKPKSNLEILTIRWCIENALLLQEPNPCFEMYTYEAIKDDITLFLHICKKYKLEPLKNIQEVYKQPSSKTHPKSSIRSGKRTRRGFSAEEYAIINTYLDLFKIKEYKRVHYV